MSETFFYANNHGTGMEWDILSEKRLIAEAESEEAAELIVRAVNRDGAVEALLQAAKEGLSAMEAYIAIDGYAWIKAKAALRAAIAQVEGKS